MPTFGLIGYPLSHTFSPAYFGRKFVELELQDSHQYLSFEMEDVQNFLVLPQVYPDLLGCNVTIPHKEAIIPLLDELSPGAAAIGAVNTIHFQQGRSIGYNTDALGFRQDLLELLGEKRPQRALILGTGGASKAVQWVLQELDIAVSWCSRRPGDDRYNYQELDATILEAHPLIVNTTPLGMAPRVTTAPDLPYFALTSAHFCYDLIYNPAETRFLQLAAAQGAATRNGLGMLHAQAEAAWSIWTDEKEGRTSPREKRT
ncbi:MAG: shikimate dehydrogenase [Bacteroidota bacterium]